MNDARAITQIDGDQIVIRVGMENWTLLVSMLTALLRMACEKQEPRNFRTQGGSPFVHTHLHPAVALPAMQVIADILYDAVQIALSSDWDPEQRTFSDICLVDANDIHQALTQFDKWARERTFAANLATVPMLPLLQRNYGEASQTLLDKFARMRNEATA